LSVGIDGPAAAAPGGARTIRISSAAFWLTPPALASASMMVMSPVSW
jgi:hypothetical protein